MKRIRTHSTLVSASHGLTENGRNTNVYDARKRTQYSYVVRVKAAWATLCSGSCMMAGPTVLRFPSGVQEKISMSLTGGFGLGSYLVLGPASASGGQQKIELDASVQHPIGPVTLVDALAVRVR